MRKKLVSYVLVIGMLFGIYGDVNANSISTYLKQLKLNMTYNYDLDGDGDKDSIKIYKSNNKLILKVNNTSKILISKCIEYVGDSEYSINDDNYTVRIYDINKNDKTLDIIYKNDCTRILKFKDDTCKLDKTYKYEFIDGYDSNTGIITLLDEGGDGEYSKIFNKIGDQISLTVYHKIKINDYKIIKQSTANVSSWDKSCYFVALKPMIAFSSISGNRKVFTVNKNSKVRIDSLYMNGSTRYIKIKNSSSQYGYIKFDNSKLFKKGFFVKCKYGTYHYKYNYASCSCGKMKSNLRAKNFEITNLELQKDYDDYNAVGTFRNNSFKRMDYVEVMVTFYNKDGDVLCTNFSNILKLDSGENWKFIILGYNNNKAVKCKVVDIATEYW